VPDPCIGRVLPGIWACCCGHGDVSKAYVDPNESWAEGIEKQANPWTSNCSNYKEWWAIIQRHRLKGEAALAFFAQHGCGPPSHQP
jgi:hypothetical protein